MSSLHCIDGLNSTASESIGDTTNEQTFELEAPSAAEVPINATYTNKKDNKTASPHDQSASTSLVFEPGCLYWLKNIRRGDKLLSYERHCYTGARKVLDKAGYGHPVIFLRSETIEGERYCASVMVCIDRLFPLLITHEA